jgi:hypothetical protein
MRWKNRKLSKKGQQWKEIGKQEVIGEDKDRRIG